ncbi:MAG TPA: hypothetical protein VII47_07295 [Actinomycetota bacterium]|jgi:hypothetical protein
MDVERPTYEPGPQRAQSREWPATAVCSPSMCPTCGDMPLLWAARSQGGSDKPVTCPICYMRVRVTPS